ncbi:hypothetical protein HK105_208619 [Polyrhizophydium stewartii]|uniref:Condensation domain-containing protein n=1 Tax=Polyrhizophydium stewartii TaxID=2732419 RepID=A0ABR4MXF5_9FUNG
MSAGEPHASADAYAAPQSLASGQRQHQHLTQMQTPRRAADPGSQAAAPRQSPRRTPMGSTDLEPAALGREGKLLSHSLPMLAGSDHSHLPLRSMSPPIAAGAAPASGPSPHISPQGPVRAMSSQQQQQPMRASSRQDLSRTGVRPPSSAAYTASTSSLHRPSSSGLRRMSAGLAANAQQPPTAGRQAEPLKVTGSGSKAVPRSRPASSGRRLSFADDAGMSASIKKSDTTLFREIHAGDMSDMAESDTASNSGDRGRRVPSRKASRPLPELPPWNPSTRFQMPEDKNLRAPSALGHQPASSGPAGGGAASTRILPASLDPRKQNLPTKLSVVSKSDPSNLAGPGAGGGGSSSSLAKMKSGGSFADLASPAFSPSSRFDQLPDGRTKGRFRATPLQWDIYTRLHPSKDEKESPTYTPYQGPQFILSQAYVIANHSLNRIDLVHVVNKVASLYTVVRTQFYRNERILDADVEGIIDRRQWQEVPDDAFVEIVDAQSHAVLMRGLESGDIVGGVAEFSQNWIENISEAAPFGVLAIVFPPCKVPGGDADGDDEYLASSTAEIPPPSPLQPPPQGPNGFFVLVFAASMLVADDLSLTWIAREVVILYRECYRLHKFGKSDSEIVARVDSHASIESEQFHEFANECKRAKTDMAFWRAQCIEVKQDTVERSEKDDLEGQLRRLGKEKEVLRTSLSSLSKRKTELEAELKILRQQRREIDKGENGEGIISTYLDAASGEVIQITREARMALIKAVLGEDAATDNIMGLLDKHEVPKEAQRKIDAPSLTLETFAAITEASVEDLGLMSRDRRKIVALAEYVRNRIKDCLHEQTKVKFALERKIAKVTRDLESATDGVRSTQNLLESNDDLSIRLNYILKPPYVETKIMPLSLAGQYEKTPHMPASIDSSSRWGFVPLSIDAETLDNLRRFRANWAIAVKNRQKQRRADPNVSSDNESLLDSEDSDGEEKSGTGAKPSPLRNQTHAATADQASGPAAADQAEQPETTHTKRMKVKSIEVVCLAAFAVLLKHITGNDKFLLGISQSYRRHGLFVGPLSDTMPIKVDVSKPGLTFDSLFASLFKIFRDSRRHGVACTRLQVAGAYGITADLDVRFEFFSLRETKEWLRRGMTPADFLLGNAPCFKAEGIQTQRIWADNDTDQYDIKLVIVETPTGIEGGIRYLRCRYDEEKITKWMAKYQLTLEGIDYGPRKIPISSLISR